jgi:hypothetical protein
MIHMMIANQIQKDALAAAEQERLLRQIAQSRMQTLAPRRLWMARLGEQMVVWGQDLKARSIRA